jgi:glycosyltransferase involved in cell wall biosynthesis
VFPKKISIIVPCYNQESFLEETLLSVQNQTYKDWECLLINDGSTDRTEEICKNWVEKNERFLYFYTTNKGVSNARNIGLKAATGDFIQFLDGDDLLDHKKFEKSFQNHSDCDLIFTEFKILTNNKFFDGYNKLKSDYFNFEEILMKWNVQFTIPIHTALISKDFIKDFLFDTSLLCFEDWLMWLHLFHKNPKVGFLDEPLAIYRKEDAITSASSSREKIAAQEILVIPKIKILFGEELHDKFCYNLLRMRTSQNSSLKKELKKIQEEKFISKYIKLKTFYYQHFKKT